MNSFLGILGCSYYFDHYIISSFFLSNCSSYYYPCIFLLSNILSSFYYSQSFCFGLIWGLRNFLSSSSYYFDLGSTLWNWIAVLGTYSIFAFSFSFSSSLYSWQSCCYVPFYLFDINRFLLSIEGVNFYFPSFLIEFSMSFFLVSYYWHFVDWIWFLVFLFFLLLVCFRMISNLGSNLVFSEIEYFTYLNLWLVSLSLLLVIFFLLLSSSLLTIVSIYLNAAWMEFFLTLFSLWFLWLIISPSLILLLVFLECCFGF
jgi:hypothetical protein